MSKQEVAIQNYITINRRLFTHPFWDENRPFSRFEAWLDLIQQARFEITEARKLIEGKLIIWNRGELPASLRFLAERWGWSKNKVDHFLRLLEIERMIVKKTAEGTSQTIITLCNYDSYNIRAKNEGQVKGQTRDRQGTASGQARDKTNIDNIEEEGEGTPGEAPARPPTVEEMYKGFIGWINKYAPTVNRMRQPFTIEEYVKMKDQLSKEDLKTYLLRMHNWKPLLQKNNSAYLTLLNWIEKDKKAPPVKPINGRYVQQSDDDILKSIGIQ